jgi:hypothetical protein
MDRIGFANNDHVATICRADKTEAKAAGAKRYKKLVH